MIHNALKVRPLIETDFHRLNEIRRSKDVSRFILSLCDETISQTICYFTDKQDLKHTYIAEVTDKGHDVAGYIRLFIDEDVRRRHKGKISMAISNEYQCAGIGGVLLDSVIDLAENWLKLKKLELTVLTTNTKAVKLYKSKGFEVDGILRADTVVSGSYEDVYIMSRFLKE